MDLGKIRTLFTCFITGILLIGCSGSKNVQPKQIELNQKNIVFPDLKFSEQKSQKAFELFKSKANSGANQDTLSGLLNDIFSTQIHSYWSEDNEALLSLAFFVLNIHVAKLGNGKKPEPTQLSVWEKARVVALNFLLDTRLRKPKPKLKQSAAKHLVKSIKTLEDPGLLLNTAKMLVSNLGVLEQDERGEFNDAFDEVINKKLLSDQDETSFKSYNKRISKLKFLDGLYGLTWNNESISAVYSKLYEATGENSVKALTSELLDFYIDPNTPEQDKTNIRAFIDFVEDQNDTFESSPKKQKLTPQLYKNTSTANSVFEEKENVQDKIKEYKLKPLPTPEGLFISGSAAEGNLEVPRNAEGVYEISTVATGQEPFLNPTDESLGHHNKVYWGALGYVFETQNDHLLVAKAVDTGGWGAKRLQKEWMGWYPKEMQLSNRNTLLIKDIQEKYANNPWHKKISTLQTKSPGSIHQYAMAIGREKSVAPMTPGGNDPHTPVNIVRPGHVYYIFNMIKKDNIWYVLLGQNYQFLSEYRSEKGFKTVMLGWAPADHIEFFSGIYDGKLYARALEDTIPLYSYYEWLISELKKIKPDRTKWKEKIIASFKKRFYILNYTDKELAKMNSFHDISVLLLKKKDLFILLPDNNPVLRLPFNEMANSNEEVTKAKTIFSKKLLELEKYFTTKSDKNDFAVRESHTSEFLYQDIWIEKSDFF